MANDPRDRAVDMIVHYLAAIAKRAGMPWDNDYSVEIGQAVDDIITAATVATIKQIEGRLDALEEQVDYPNWRDLK